MQILIAAIGKLRAGPERDLVEEYIKRLPWNISFKEYESKISSAAARKEDEVTWLLETTTKADHLIALDERGKSLSSKAFAAHIGKQQTSGRKQLAFIIGGADGLTDIARSKANMLFSFGSLTWPHMMVRAMLAEQLYRSYSILSHHPYHRE